MGSQNMKIVADFGARSNQSNKFIYNPIYGKESKHFQFSEYRTFALKLGSFNTALIYQLSFTFWAVQLMLSFTDKQCNKSAKSSIRHIHGILQSGKPIHSFGNLIRKAL